MFDYLKGASYGVVWSSYLKIWCAMCDLFESGGVCCFYWVGSGIQGYYKINLKLKAYNTIQVFSIFSLLYLLYFTSEPTILTSFPSWSQWPFPGIFNIFHPFLPFFIPWVLQKILKYNDCTSSYFFSPNKNIFRAFFLCSRKNAYLPTVLCPLLSFGLFASTVSLLLFPVVCTYRPLWLIFLSWM